MSYYTNNPNNDGIFQLKEGLVQFFPPPPFLRAKPPQWNAEAPFKFLLLFFHCTKSVPYDQQTSQSCLSSSSSSRVLDSKGVWDSAGVLMSCRAWQAGLELLGSRAACYSTRQGAGQPKGHRQRGDRQVGGIGGSPFLTKAWA